ncbi:hypothetical protein NUH30_10185 [Leptospira sp. 85282-16]|uniref:Lipoprotein n=1 Tax=Leptospira montravelensis TaxID=2484961 RepID=A0ABY2LN87_9LEPT|nr:MULTISPECIES: hypothetical protein [Leptospira]MCT8334042.1 hypothetical protein [Leptospira sp. 85282-16]TGK80434.1 hypothetical protein EHQ19_12185 [Leptospira montravelensis]TGL00610.1 hypothetical protein EHQ31_17615 [Leptospira montravelensis]
MNFIYKISIVLFFINCNSSFYTYTIKENNVKYSSNLQHSSTTKKNILFLTEGYLDDLADLLVKRGHNVDRMKISKENFQLGSNYDLVVVLNSNTLDINKETYYELPNIFTLGLIPYYANFNRNYEFFIFQNNKQININYSLSLTQYRGWPMLLINLFRDEKKALYFPNTELNIKLSNIIENK